MVLSGSARPVQCVKNGKFGQVHPRRRRSRVCAYRGARNQKQFQASHQSRMCVRLTLWPSRYVPPRARTSFRPPGCTMASTIRIPRQRWQGRFVQPNAPWTASEIRWRSESRLMGRYRRPMWHASPSMSKGTVPYSRPGGSMPRWANSLSKQYATNSILIPPSAQASCNVSDL